MKQSFILTAFLTLTVLFLFFSLLAYRPDPSSIIMAGGLLLLFSLAIYVFFEIRKSIQLCERQTKKM